MTSPYAISPQESSASDPLYPEKRLEHSRALLRERLGSDRQHEQEEAESGTLSRLANVAVPVARQAVRRHPYASLSSAALVGALLMRWRPWRGVAGSLLAGLVTRQVFSAAVSSGQDAVQRMLARSARGGARRL